MIKFYNVKKRESVEIAENDCKKVVYTRKISKGTQERYAVCAQDEDGTNLTKFINKDTYDKLSCPKAK